MNTRKNKGRCIMDELLKLLSNVPTSVALQFLMGLTAVIVSINAVIIKLFNSLEK